MPDNQVLVNKHVLENALDVIGEWLEDLVYNVYERDIDADTTASYQEILDRANVAYDDLVHITDLSISINPAQEDTHA